MSEPAKVCGAPNRSYCCYPGCTAPAEYEIHQKGHKSPPRTEACAFHAMTMQEPNEKPW